MLRNRDADREDADDENGSHRPRVLPVHVQWREEGADALDDDLPCRATQHFLALAAVDAIKKVFAVAGGRLLVALETEECLELCFAEQWRFGERLVLHGYEWLELELTGANSESHA